MQSNHDHGGNPFTPLAIFLCVAAVYLAFLTKNYYWDGVTFALGIESATTLDASLFHPSHLFYNVFGYIAYRATHFVGLEMRALTVLQVSNCLFGALTAAMIYFIGRRVFRSVYIATILAFLFAFSATWWKFATDANAYIPSILFLTIAFYLIVPGTRARPFAVAFFHILAMCFHQLAIFFFPVVVIGLYIQNRRDPRGRVRNIWLYTVMAGPITFGLYWLCFYLQTGGYGFGELMSWMTYYSPENGFVFNAIESLSRTFSGTVKLFFGGRLSYFVETLAPLTIALAIIGLLALGAFLVSLISGLRRRNSGEMPFGSRIDLGGVSMLCLTWLSVYAVFLFFWIPKNTFYRMFYLAPLVVLFGVWLSRSTVIGRHRAIAPMFVAAMVLANFLFLIYPYSRVRAETPLYMANEMTRVWSPKSVVFYSTIDSDSDLVRYLNPGVSWKKLGEIDPQGFDNELRQIYAAGGDAWVEHSAIDTIAKRTDLAQWWSAISNAQPVHKVNDPAYDVRFVKVVPATR